VDAGRGYGRAVQVFLSYRRGDAGGYAGRLADGLRQHLGAKSVFQDVTAIAPGQDYTAAIDRALDNCDAVLVVIGPGWLTAVTDQGTPRLSEPHDYVRLELARALDRNIRVIPVLVGGAVLPAATDLPGDLQRLTQRQAVVLHDETWHQDVEGLVRSMRGEPAVPTRRSRRWLVAAAVAVMLVVLGASAWAWWGPSNGAGGQAESAAEPPPCGPPNGTGWHPIALSNNPTGEENVTGGSLIFTVRDARWRPHDGRWQVTLGTSMKNATPEHQYHGDWRYSSLVVGQRVFKATCFAPTPNLVSPETVGDALIGFDVTCKPDGYIQLIVENDSARISVTDDTLEPAAC
jgi:TIR domain